jgi:PD-(D/E)XK nuclease superfamily
MTGLVTAAPHNSMNDLFARRSKVATRAIGIADVLTPVQVRVFSDCEMRWFYEHLLAVPDPPTASMALDGAIRAALITNFRHKLQCKEDLQTEAVVELFRRAWQKQQVATFCDDEHPDRIGGIGEELVRIYMRRAAPPIQPAAIEQRTMRGVLASVRIQAQFDILDEDGMIIAITTAQNAPSRIDAMHRFELTTCYRLAHGASGVVRSDTLVHSENPRCVSQVWEINEADIQLTNALYPLAQKAMRRGYYMPNRASVHCSRHQCPHWRRCEQDFGGVVAA